VVNAPWTYAFLSTHLFLMLAGMAYDFTTYIPVTLAARHQTKFVALAFAHIL